MSNSGNTSGTNPTYPAPLGPVPDEGQSTEEWLMDWLFVLLFLSLPVIVLGVATSL